MAGSTRMKKISLLKTYGDFKHLDEFVRLSDLDVTINGGELPEFPPKRNVMGVKKSGNELQVVLQDWLQEFIKLPLVTRMLCVKNFFSVGIVADDIDIGREAGPSTTMSISPNALMNSGKDSLLNRDASLINYHN